MSLVVSFENGHSNGVDFFTAVQGESGEQVLAAVVRMWESFKSVPASLGGAVLRSTDESSVAIYQMWVKDSDLGEYHEQLGSELEVLEAIADINPNFFEPVAAEAKQAGVGYVLEKGGVYGIQVFALEDEKCDSIVAESQRVLKELLGSVEGLEWYIVLRSWDKSKLMLLARIASPEQKLRDSVFGPVDLGLRDIGTVKEVENVFRVVES